MDGSVGVDFGTSTTFVASTDRRGRTQVLPLGSVAQSADLFLPSVARPQGRDYVVGEEPSNQAAGIIRSVKRSITRNLDTVATLGAEPQTCAADEVIAAIMRETVSRIRRITPKALDGRPVRLGCPAMWDGHQRRRLTAIAEASGLDVAVNDVVDEPIAAGVGWVNEERAAGRHVSGRVLVVDIGGGTLDVAFLDVVDDGRQPTFNVLSADAQDSAGDDIDDLIAAELAEELAAQGRDPADSADPLAADALLKQAARQLKIRLSSAREASVGVPNLLGVAQVSYSRSALEDLLQPMLRQTEGLARSVIASGRLRERNASSPEKIRKALPGIFGDVQHVLLTGGTSQIPIVRDHFTALFADAHVVWSQSVGAQQAVAMGLAATDDYKHLNLHRPPFDLVAVSNDGSETVLYGAYTPLYESWQVQSGQTQLGYTAFLPDHGRTRRATHIVCRDLGGRHIPIVTIGHGGAATERESLPFDAPADGRGSIKLYVDGKLVLNGAGGPSAYRMKSWPVLRADDRGVPSPIVWQEEPRQYHDAMTYRDSGEPG